MESVYLDHNATTPPLPQVVEAVTDALTRGWANPSSVHRAGQEVRRRLELARSQVGELIGCRDRELIFTSGATEANNLALRGIVDLRDSPRRSRKVVITTTTEHSAVREPCDELERLGYEVIRLPVDRNGLVDVGRFDELLAERGDEIALVSIHWANNETGVIQPIEHIGQACREAGVPFHTDGTQAVGKLPIDLAQLPIDAMSLSAHKFHGPKGVGALYVRSRLRLRPQVLGGPQERERRGGTENAPGIIGMGVAAHLAGRWLEEGGPTQLAAMRDRLEQAIIESVDQAKVNADDAPRLCNTTNIAFPPLEAEAILIMLSERGIYASAGAACSSGSLEPSPVLLAMGIGEPAAHGSIRFSLSRLTTDAELDRAVAVVPEVIAKLRTSMPV